MAVSVDWYDEKHNIILWRYFGNFVLEDMLVGDEQLNYLSQQVSGRFDIIVDLSDASYSPPVGTLWEWEQVATRRSLQFPNWGLTVFVATTEVYEAYLHEGIQTSDIIRKHARKTKTIAEAVMTILANRQAQTH